ncbi:hypothetical protein T12_4456 [Trichinella patagoniensis]|uniref:Uncharacterized protein n=1 Tax=Trichinella patagoniensis TaxID=990121 RepID=A0A0V0Z8Y4_9BILA|nr:hypothetical protein T12_4456 [Trichinella patagoniensis]
MKSFAAMLVTPNIKQILLAFIKKSFIYPINELSSKLLLMLQKVLYKDIHLSIVINAKKFTASFIFIHFLVDQIYKNENKKERKNKKKNKNNIKEILKNPENTESMLHGTSSQFNLTSLQC